MEVGDGIKAGRAAWSFDGELADKFVSHASRSIPWYEAGHDLVCYLSDFFVQPDSTVYELGCSTAELTGKLAAYNAHKPHVRWHGLDCEEAMVAKARQHCGDFGNVSIHCVDVLDFDFEPADMIVAYYTVQFIPERHRQVLIDRIYQALNWGGAFVLFEKVGAPDARFQDMASTLYRDFKRRNELSAEEILNKDDSLKGVLKPFSTAGNLGLLERAGFVDVMSIMKYVCFEGFVAIK